MITTATQTRGVANVWCDAMQQQNDGPAQGATRKTNDRLWAARSQSGASETERDGPQSVSVSSWIGGAPPPDTQLDPHNQTYFPPPRADAPRMDATPPPPGRGKWNDKPDATRPARDPREPTRYAAP